MKRILNRCRAKLVSQDPWGFYVPLAIAVLIMAVTLTNWQIMTFFICTIVILLGFRSFAASVNELEYRRRSIEDPIGPKTFSVAFAGHVLFWGLLIGFAAAAALGDKEGLSMSITYIYSGILAFVIVIFVLLGPKRAK